MMMFIRPGDYTPQGGGAAIAAGEDFICTLFLKELRFSDL